MSDFFYNPTGNFQLSAADRAALRGGERAAENMQALQAELNRLTLACAAMWSLLKEHGHTDEELMARMQEFDLRDGKLDGSLPADVVSCKDCGRKSKASRRTCLYCGKPLPAGPAFGASS